MTCKDIEHTLPAYLEDLLSPEEKMLTEEHLASCRQCSKALEELKRTEKLVRELEEVEPPPWFTQKIMSRVREEEKRKKGIIQKLFYPLHIKVPIQALATVLIAVLVIHVYRAGEPEMKAVITPPAAFLKAGKEQAPLESRKAPQPLPARAAKEKSLPAGDGKEDKAKAFAPSSVISDKTEERKESRSREEREPLTERPPVFAKKREAAKDKMIEYKRTERMYDEGTLAGGQREHEPAPQVMSAAVEKPVRTVVTVHVRDTNTAAGEVETLLGKLGARNVKRRHLEGREVLTGELQAKNAKELMEKLRTIGETKDTTMPSDIGERNISITIELFSNR
jgi:anti-sigma factor RsiW